MKRLLSNACKLRKRHITLCKGFQTRHCLRGVGARSDSCTLPSSWPFRRGMKYLMTRYHLAYPLMSTCRPQSR
jgi:hypothetical protein